MMWLWDLLFGNRLDSETVVLSACFMCVIFLLHGLSSPLLVSVLLPMLLMFFPPHFTMTLLLVITSHSHS